MNKKSEYPESQFRESEAQLIVGLQTKLGKNAPVEIPKLWEQLNSLRPKIPSKKGSAAYGLCIGSETGMEYLCGIEVERAENLPDNFSAKKLPASTYATFSHDGHISTLRRTIDEIWNKSVPNASFNVDEKLGFFFERYSEEFNPKTGTGGIEIWIPIKQ